MLDDPRGCPAVHFYNSFVIIGTCHLGFPPPAFSLLLLLLLLLLLHLRSKNIRRRKKGKRRRRRRRNVAFSISVIWVVGLRSAAERLSRPLRFFSFFTIVQRWTSPINSSPRCFFKSGFLFANQSGISAAFTILASHLSHWGISPGILDPSLCLGIILSKWGRKWPPIRIGLERIEPQYGHAFSWNRWASSQPHLHKSAPVMPPLTGGGPLPSRKKSSVSEMSASILETRMNWYRQRGVWYQRARPCVCVRACFSDGCNIWRLRMAFRVTRDHSRWRLMAAECFTFPSLFPLISSFFFFYIYKYIFFLKFSFSMLVIFNSNIFFFSGFGSGNSFSKYFYGSLMISLPPPPPPPPLSTFPSSFRFLLLLLIF